MVRLGVEQPLCGQIQGVRFQFQYGAIGRGRSLGLSFVTDKFQFQYGAIGSMVMPLNFNPCSSNFNSSMVRLGGY